MLTLSPEELRNRAERLGECLSSSDGPAVRLSDGSSAAGGGAFPGAALPTTLVLLDPGVPSRPLGAHSLARRLRLGDPPIIARIQDEQVVLDPRTLPDDQLEVVAEAVQRAWEAE